MPDISKFILNSYINGVYQIKHIFGNETLLFWIILQILEQSVFSTSVNVF